MKISRHLHQQIRLKNLLFTLCIIGSIVFLGWLSTRYSVQTDITGNAANTLSPASQQLLQAMPGEIRITAYLKHNRAVKDQVSQLINRYRQHKQNMTVNFIDPESQPDKSRELNIGSGGLFLVEYQGRNEKISFLDESSLTNALMQLASAKERWVTFLSGHGERSPEGAANFDFSQFGKELSRRKINAQTLNLAALPAIPDNSALLVIAAPTVSFLPGEYAMIRQYLDKGGNLFLLSEPDNKHTDMLKSLGLQQLPGTVVDNNAKIYGINDPSFILVSEYQPHPITQGFLTLSLFPAAAAFILYEDSEFQAETLFSSSSQSWTETRLQGQIRFDADSKEQQGPLNFAYALTRNLENNKQQRIVAIGDSDFLANAYIGNVGNLELGLRIVNWLIHDDRFIPIPAKTAVDSRLLLSKTSVAIIGFGFLIVIPLLLFCTGFVIWRNRKRR